MTTILLTDNGSKRAEATLVLRQLARELGIRTNQEIYPVSLQHVDSIPAEELNGKPACTLKKFIEEHLDKGERDFIILPLFFSVSRALTAFIPQQIISLENIWGKIDIMLADVLYPLSYQDEKQDVCEPLLVDILEDYIRLSLKSTQAIIDTVILVDHGSPKPQVTAVRRHIAQALQKRFVDRSCIINEAVMERRPGKSYDFNGELLESRLLELASRGINGAIVAKLFLLPGRHAGKNGDIDTICKNVTDRYPNFEIKLTRLISQHEKLIEILQYRLGCCMSS